MTDERLRIDDLTVAYRLGNRAENVVVSNVSLGLRVGEVVGLVGESGCGKSTLALAGIGYRAGNARIRGGSAWLDGTDLLTLSTRRLRGMWGKRIAYVGQSASTSLNPALTVGRQLASVLSHHLGLRAHASVDRQAEMLDEVGIPEPEHALGRYPTEFSGGQQQRIAIAIALAARPEVIVLDEPTTGLDVTTQARITQILKRMLADTGAATLYVSHDLSLLSTLCDRMLVMYAGEIVEAGVTTDVVGSPAHPYTRALMASVPRVDRPAALQGLPGRPPASVVTDRCAFSPRCAHALDRCDSRHPQLDGAEGERRVRCVRAGELARFELAELGPASEPLPTAHPSADGPTLLEVSELEYSYSSSGIPAVAGVSFSLGVRETVGVVGESGSGKTTLLRALAGVISPTGGEIRYGGDPLPSVSGRSRRQLGDIQLVFQNPESSLNPRHTIRDLIRRPLKLFRPDVTGKQASQVITDTLDAVALPSSVLGRLPGELSGRTDAARRARSGVRRPAAAVAVRRGHVRARCVGPGHDPQSDPGSRHQSRHGRGVRLT